MFQLLLFDLKNRFTSLSTIIYFSVFFVLSFFLALVCGGAFGLSIPLGFSQKLAINSPAVLDLLIGMMGYFGLLIAAPIFGQSINRDFETGFCQVLFATPIRKSTYFFTRYVSAFLTTLMILLSCAFSFWIATMMPFLPPSMVLPNHLWYYVAPYLSSVIPNILFFGAIFLAVVAKSKKMAPVYVASIVIFTGFMIAGQFTNNLENKLLTALLDPFGSTASREITRYWSIAELSTKVVPLTGFFLINRLLWGVLGTLLLLLSYFSFNPFSLSKEKKIVEETLSLEKLSKPKEEKLLPHSWKVCLQLSLSEFRQVFSNVFFLILLLCGVTYIFAISGQADKMYGTATLPVTYKVLEFLSRSFIVFVVIITFFYAGELVWKDKDKRAQEIIDSKPVSSAFLYLSKLFSLFLMQIFLLGIVFISCVLIQVFKGYYTFEWSLYFQYLFLYTLPSWLLSCVLALFIHTLASNKSLGHFILIFSFFLIGYLPLLGLDHHLYLIGVFPQFSYSDMNKFRGWQGMFTCFTFYSGFFYFFLAIITLLFWKRGFALTVKERLLEFKHRIKPIHKWLAIGSLSLWISLGVVIYYNTNVLNVYKSSNTLKRESADYELTYKSFEKMPHPNLTAVKVWVDIFPESQRLHGKGSFHYRNTTEHPIKTLFFNISPKSQIDHLTFSKTARLKKHDKRLGVWIYDLEKPLSSEEELELEFDLNVVNKGFENNRTSWSIVENGTFIQGSEYFPFIGYCNNKELQDDRSRKKYKLPKRPRMASIDDQEALKKTYISQEGAWIDFEATVSTSEDQIALAPGHLEKEWKEGNRRYFHYKMNRPILSFYAFLSGRYAVTSDHWNDVKIEVYHHPSHTKNISRMIQSVKKSLDYYTKQFSPYPFKEVRIIEFPRYQAFAQSFPTFIPYSEAIGFIAKVNPLDPKDVDYPFYVTAHEMAHQWWAHQVIGGNVQGAEMLSESLSQYSALMVMEKEFGPEQMKKFLHYELDHYLRMRGIEMEQELPLVLCEHQGYLHYHKGSLVFYALKDYLGEDKLNKILKNYRNEVAYQKPPFTRAVDLVERFKEHADKNLIEDLFETITFYDNRTDLVFYKEKDGQYEVEIHSTNKKTRSDGIGHEREIPMDDFIDVGIYDQKGNLQYLQKHKVKSGPNLFRIQVKSLPSKAGIDPLNKLIDKVSDNKVKKALPLLPKK